MTLGGPRRLSERARQSALRECEKIAAKDRSNLFLVSQYLCDRRRYEAFVAMYSVMRVIDDLVDGIPDIHALSRADRERRLSELTMWRRRIYAAYVGAPQPDALDVALAATLPSFPIPFDVWSRFLDAMAYDLEHDRFATKEDFLNYAEGAAAAPTIVYVFLLSAQPEEPVRPGEFVFLVKEMADGFDYEACGRALGVFAYMAHILRDVGTDLRRGKRGRVYIPLSDLTQAGLSENEFYSMVRSGSGDLRWRALVSVLCRRARNFEQLGVSMARARLPAMDADCRFVLTLIIRFYQDLLGRIEADPEAVLGGEIIQKDSDRLRLVNEARAEAQALDGVNGAWIRGDHNVPRLKARSKADALRRRGF